MNNEVTCETWSDRLEDRLGNEEAFETSKRVMTVLTGMEAPKKDDRLIFPLDLSLWAPRETLLKCIQEKINAFNWQRPELLRYLKTHPNYRPKELLILLSFAYATGVFDSQSIEARCWKEDTYRAICGEHVPEAQYLARFRRENRGLLKWLLAEVLKEVFREKYALGPVVFPAGMRRYLIEKAVERLDLARHQDRGD